MAPAAEGAKAEDGPSRTVSREDLEKALADNTQDQLREAAARLTKSVAGLKEMLADLETEKLALRDEGDELNNTITLMMQEMHKLNINASNTVEPQLLEGPLDFVGRFWEKHKPRDTAYQTSEHVGEIRKPVPGDGRTPDVQQVVQEAGQQVVQTAQKIQSALGPLWARTQGLIREKQTEAQTAWAGVLAARSAPPKTEPKKSGKKSGKRSGGYPDAGAAEPAASAAAASSSEAPPAAVEVPAASAADGEAVAPAAAATEAAETNDGNRMPGAEERIASTILIEAKLTIDDGSELTLYVRAEDRCKDVAHKFVQDNSLKAWFQEPLTKWLKKVENDAVTFPVQVQGDLLEIRKQFSKK